MDRDGFEFFRGCRRIGRKVYEVCGDGRREVGDQAIGSFG
jgi:hypothetical protein